MFTYSKTLKLETVFLWSVETESESHSGKYIGSSQRLGHNNQYPFLNNLKQMDMHVSIVGHVPNPLLNAQMPLTHLVVYKVNHFSVT